MTLTTVVMVCALLVVFTSSSFAQENPIYQLPDNTDSQSMSRTSTRVTTYPEDLLYDLEPSVYIKNNQIIEVTEGQKPKVVKLKDTNSFNILSSDNDLFKRVEMITINIKSASDLMRPFNVDNIRGFGSLKYIYLKCESSVTESQIRNFIQQADSEISIFYKIFNRS
ncbi:hypothetical protein [Bizionia sp. M204]|uniref:hypothetical protein n=1 Tax=unclassified Bizionia TaxID=2626393 RepID=UPI002048EAAD|nr:hypothetical protein [Bizionia sp. M204]UPS90846.1 hypothetical protein GMA17_03560 [Bizionia sp. M204]